MLPVIGPLRLWEDPEVVSIGRLPMHVPLVRCNTSDEARSEATPWRLDLNGTWQFRHSFTRANFRNRFTTWPYLCEFFRKNAIRSRV